MKGRVDDIEHYIGLYVINAVCRVRNIRYLHAIKSQLLRGWR